MGALYAVGGGLLVLGAMMQVQDRNLPWWIVGVIGILACIAGAVCEYANHTQ